jgi:hypothetical protein
MQRNHWNCNTGVAAARKSSRRQRLTGVGTAASLASIPHENWPSKCCCWMASCFDVIPPATASCAQRWLQYTFNISLQQRTCGAPSAPICRVAASAGRGVSSRTRRHAGSPAARCTTAGTPPAARARTIKQSKKLPTLHSRPHVCY